MSPGDRACGECGALVPPSTVGASAGLGSRCADCGAALGKGDAACGDCGRLVSPDAGASTERRCDRCGGVLGASDAVCGECGTRIAPKGPIASAAVEASVEDDDDWDDDDDEEAVARAVEARRERAAAASKAAHVLYVVPESGARSLGPTLERYGEVLVVPASEAAIGRVQARLSRGAKPGAVCVLGGDHELPMARVEDPAGHDDAVLTDNFFGRTSIPSDADRFTGDLLPEVPVSRIPSLVSSLVERLLSDAPQLCSTWDDGFALSAAVWSGASAAVAEAIFGANGPKLQLSPPADEAAVRERLGKWPGRLYFNVHGSADEPQWVGEGSGGYTAVLSPDSIDVARRAIVVSEACYGALGFPDDGGGIADHFLASGAACFVGSTIIAWGPAVPPPGSADLIVVGFYNALDDGMTAAEALLHAKRAILERALEEHGELSPPEHNTLLSFVHYGAAHARVGGPRARAKAAGRAGIGGASRAQSGLTSRGSALEGVRSRMGGASSGVVGRARDRIGARLGPSDWKVLSQGRIELAKLPSEFRAFAEIQRALAELLGAQPTSVSVFRYQAGQARRAHVTSAVRAPWGGTKAAALLLDENECVIRRWVSR